VVILEEDLRISPDFFDYFAYTAPLLDSDSRLLTVSAFNDNGEEGLVRDPTRILRSDFFPGLGWMMTRQTVGTQSSRQSGPWEFWDDWLRAIRN
jgi:alpha-1,3-mannosyl-glycoprotein beta-1,2-N-acetylglucosaminyltransferase